ncbi:hypothetical protein PN462_12550 [Spirulina sp. CS-785/01]|uniref:hypothetical protein n=1 Tax=Spirulina sp. CS-785/01 TaxID=3021716 RepID=UPI00232B5DA7|nr:hypothetical protein [Spirulina sp. CS-785/01]MDB9313935.1 hypothetical protein [Spirulina sp. CS-785/01]
MNNLGQMFDEQRITKQWWRRFVALIALVNLILVFFNITYIPFRDIYVRHLPPLVSLYDPVKSITPDPDTQNYLQTVQEFKDYLKNHSLESPKSQEYLAYLRTKSQEILAENPFSVANKFGTFAQLKRRMERRMNTDSAQQAFADFWSQAYLEKVTPENALNFFETKLEPLLAVNYFRTVDENGQFIDNFWRIDIYFMLFFALEFFGRTFWVSKKHEDLSWGDAILRRWYEAILFFPLWRWLRILPVSVYLHKSELLNTERILAEVTHEPAAYLADRVSLFLMVRLISQSQDSVQKGEATQALLNPEDYVQVTDVDKLDAISDRILQLAIYNVLPQLKPDLEALLRHSLHGAFHQSDWYQGMRNVPGIKQLPQEALEQIADYLAQGSVEFLASSYGDERGRELFEQLTAKFKHYFRETLRDRKTQAELEEWLTDLLEEFKINYVQKSQQNDPEETLAEAEQILQENS